MLHKNPELPLNSAEILNKERTRLKDRFYRLLATTNSQDFERIWFNEPTISKAIQGERVHIASGELVFIFYIAWQHRLAVFIHSAKVRTQSVTKALLHYNQGGNDSIYMKWLKGEVVEVDGQTDQIKPEELIPLFFRMVKNGGMAFECDRIWVRQRALLSPLLHGQSVTSSLGVEIRLSEEEIVAILRCVEEQKIQKLKNHFLKDNAYIQAIIKKYRLFEADKTPQGRPTDLLADQPAPKKRRESVTASTSGFAVFSAATPTYTPTPTYTQTPDESNAAYTPFADLEEDYNSHLGF